MTDLKHIRTDKAGVKAGEGILQPLVSLRTGLQFRKAIVDVAYFNSDEDYYVLDVLVTVKRMTNSEIARREKAEQQQTLEVEREDDGGVDEADTENGLDMTQRTTHDIEQWTVPRNPRR